MKKAPLLIVGAIAASLLGAGLTHAREIETAEKIKPKPPIELSLEKKVSQPQISINFDFKTQNEQNPVSYQTSETIFNNQSGYLWRSSNIPELTPEDGLEAENVLRDISNIKGGDINSYQEFLNVYSPLSENQKIVLLSAIGNLLNKFNYDMDFLNSIVLSQDEFFQKFQYSLQSGVENGLGVCKHIASHLEKLANDSGMRASAVSGIRNDIGHMFVILKTEEGSAVCDSFYTLITKTKNIEKVLRVYQKDDGTTAFDHMFFEDSKFKYRIITDDGRTFLDFIGYDESPETLKKILLNDTIDNKANLIIDISKSDYLTSLGINYHGFFVKGGEILGKDFSPLQEMDLIQAGFRRGFPFPNISIYPDINFLLSNMIQDRKPSNNGLIGLTGNFIVKTNNEKGFNFASRLGGNFSLISASPYSPFSDLTIEGAGSYTIPLGDRTTITPYSILKSNFLPHDAGTFFYQPKLSELGLGGLFDIKSGKTGFSINPYYSWRIWEQEFGMSAEIKTEHFGLRARGYVTKPSYDFCPEKSGFNAGLTLKTKNSSVGVDYSVDRENYDGEIDMNHKLGVSAGVKY